MLKIFSGTQPRSNMKGTLKLMELILMAYCEKHNKSYIVVCPSCAHNKRRSPRKSNDSGNKWQGQKFYTVGG